MTGGPWSRNTDAVRLVQEFVDDMARSMGRSAPIVRAVRPCGQFNEAEALTESGEVLYFFD